MFEAFRVGPVATHDKTFTLYAAHSTAGGVATSIAKDDATGLGELRAKAPAGMLTCEPALAAAGRPLGFTSAALSEGARMARASFATMLGFGAGVEGSVITQVPQLLDVARHFLRERPWQLVRAETPIEVVVELGGRVRHLVASVLGGDGQEHGISLYESAADLARFVELAEADRLDELLEVPARTLTLDGEPAWIAEAVRAAYGDTIALCLTATGPDGPRRVASSDATELAAAMFAVTRLGPGRLTAEVTLETEEHGTMRATARVADPTAISAPPLPAWAAHPLIMTGSMPAAMLTIPVLPVTDLAAAVAGLRALGFVVAETTEPTIARASWPGLLVDVIHAPASRGSGCHIVIEALDTLVVVWRNRGVDVRVVEHDGERIALIEVPGGLALAIGERMPAEYQPPAKRRKVGRKAADRPAPR